MCVVGEVSCGGVCGGVEDGVASGGEGGAGEGGLGEGGRMVGWMCELGPGTRSS